MRRKQRQINNFGTQQPALGFTPVLRAAGGAQKKNLHLCRVDSFENPHYQRGASDPDFGSHYWVGLQAPNQSKFGSQRVLYRFVKSGV